MLLVGVTTAMDMQKVLGENTVVSAIRLEIDRKMDFSLRFDSVFIHIKPAFVIHARLLEDDV